MERIGLADNRSGNQWREPRQARSRATWEAIVEAAAQILERHGPEALTTNAVAERAGVSIGTLYQYFPDKQAILIAAARREPLAGRSAALVQALIAALERLGGFGAAAPGGSVRNAHPPKRRRGPAWERRIADAVAEWIRGLIPTPTPVLRPIPIRTRQPRPPRR
ncbi:MAG TPA: helix-turn-helix domain-containing protein [Caulobacteraceae bacterium]|nr:helix-turn-helix domain-containing protein [Caulobacteraceae bacterium]